VGKIVNIPVVEHLIISLEGYYSFSRRGDIKRLEKSKKYVPGYLEVERIQKEAQRIGEEIGRKEGLKEGEKKGKKEGLKEGKQEGLKEGEKKGRKEEKIEMAKKLKEKGIDVAVITDTSGLSKEEIEKL
jgi:predicted transposase YdaD